MKEQLTHGARTTKVLAAARSALKHGESPYSAALEILKTSGIDDHKHRIAYAVAIQNLVFIELGSDFESLKQVWIATNLAAQEQL